MIIQEIQDRYNENKIWIVKHYSCGHYYLNQRLKGYMLNKRFTKVTQGYLENIGVLDMQQLNPN